MNAGIYLIELYATLSNIEHFKDLLESMTIDDGQYASHVKDVYDDTEIPVENILLKAGLLEQARKISAGKNHQALIYELYHPLSEKIQVIGVEHFEADLIVLKHSLQELKETFRAYHVK